jgi:pimeloyl-ACP methyl ester carboxylesterase
MPKLLTADKVHVYYNFINKEYCAEKPVLVFLHGWLSNWTIFKKEINFFKKKGYPVLYFDLRGHGLSDKPGELKDYDLQYMAEDLNRILQEEEISKIILVGYSMGGMIASLFALKHKEKVSKLVLVNSYYKNPLFSPNAKHFAKNKKFARLLSDFMNSHEKFRWKAERQPKTFDISKLKSNPDVVIFMHYMYNTPLPVFFATAKAMFNYDIQNEMSELTMPVLIIASSKDQFFPVSEEKFMARNILGSEMFIIEGTHTAVIKKPNEIAEKIYEFIA